MDTILQDMRHEFERHKLMAERAMANLSHDDFFRRPGDVVNPVALIVKHMAGNLTSRWTDFLTTDGEKPTRDRDGEFLVTAEDTREFLMAAWANGWGALFETLDSLSEADLAATIRIRGEALSARQAILRAMTHAAYHTGQIVYLVRLFQPNGPWLTIAPGGSRDAPGAYRR